MAFKNLRIASRFLLKHKNYTFINVLGLSASLVCVLFISLYIYDELQYDAFHRQSNNTYRVVENTTTKDGEAVSFADVNFRMATLDQSLPEIVHATRITTLGRANISTGDGEHRLYEPLNIVDANFFKVFDFPTVRGNRDLALKDPYTVAVSEALAVKLYGTVDVIGQSLYTDRDDKPFTVVAVLRDFPTNSHLKFDLLVALETFASQRWYQRSQDDWTSSYFSTYWVLDDKADVATVERAATDMVKNNRKPEDAVSNFQLQPLRDIHFQSAALRGGYNQNPGDISYIYIFGAVGLFILVIATINYINLSTSLSLTRGKEIGVKKVAGAARSNLVAQFITESTLIATVALMIALMIVNVGLPSFNAFTGKNINTELLFSARVIGTLALLALTIGFLSGLYPAFFLSRLKPVTAIKGDNRERRGSFRQALVVFQFALSITLIFGTLVAYRQMTYVQEKDLGFNEEQLVILDINSGGVRRGFQTIKNELEKIPVVKSVSVSSRVPGEWKNLPTVGISRDGMDEQMSVHFIGIDEDFLSTFGVPLASGRNFSGVAGDSLSFIINETAAKQLGYEHPLDESIEITSINFAVSDEQLDKPFRGKIIGVVKDFHFQSLHQAITPLILAYRNNPLHSIDYFSVRLTPGDWQAALDQMQTALLATDPSHTIEYNFLDERLQDFYAQDVKRSKLFAIAAGLSIGLACLGLFSLASFMIEQRTKEIGVRKVLGASSAQIVMMLSGKYMRLVLIGFVIATPLAIWVVDKWLNTFAYRISIGWISVAVAGLASVVVAVATVGYKSLRAGLMNPVKSLRSE